MPKRGGNISLNSYDELFTTEEGRQEQAQERIQEIPLSALFPFKDHPFKVVDDAAMQRTVESVAQYGVLAPAIARPRPEGGYELIAGHRRKHASELAGRTTMPVIVREMDDDTATILMVDSNLQRENILPSERAFAYKMKLDAMKRQGKRTDLERNSTLSTSTQVAQKLSVQKVGEESGISKDTVRRFIRLTNLIPELLEMVDQKRIAMNPAVEISFLLPEEQEMLLSAIEYAQATPSLHQAQQLHQLSNRNECTQDAMNEIMNEIKKDERDAITLKNDVLRKYFPRSYSPRQMQDTIIKLLQQWQRKRQQSQER